MCADTGMLLGLLLFFATVAASPFVIIAVIVNAARKRRADRVVRLLD